MYDRLISLHFRFSRFVYTHLVKKFFFLFDAEAMHHFFINVGKILGKFWLTRRATSLFFSYQDPVLEQDLLGIHFRNPLGLAAGFDKDAEIVPIIDSVGFGFSEVGSISASPCLGNSGVRIKRMKKENSLWINLGLNNLGAKTISDNLRKQTISLPFGINVARTNCKATADEDLAVQDYCESLKLCKDLGKYYVLNISCPNAFGGQPFSEKGRLEKLLKAVAKLKLSKPIFIKLSPDLSSGELDAIIALAGKYHISGFICSNLTKDKRFSSGGISGKVLEPKADKVLSYVYQKTKGKFLLIGLGGVFSAEDAYRKIRSGANLVQLVTGMIFEGPEVIGEINLGLKQLLLRDGYKTVGEAVGTGVTLSE